MNGLFATITNANFNKNEFVARIKKGLALREELKDQLVKAGGDVEAINHDAAIWTGESLEEFEAKAPHIGVLSTQNQDIRSLRELIIYGLKGMAAYAAHAEILGYEKDEIFAFMEKALAATLEDSLSIDDLVALTLETGKVGVDVMALLDEANTTTYGNPEITNVDIGVRNNPAILISCLLYTSRCV